MNLGWADLHFLQNRLQVANEVEWQVDQLEALPFDDCRVFFDRKRLTPDPNGNVSDLQLQQQNVKCKIL